MKAAYIHIPFCEHICHYCDFNKVFLQGQPVDDYLNSLKKEMELTLKAAPTDILDSIFVGGGTPTALNERQLETLLTTIHDTLPYDKNTEYTFEANPGDLNKEKFELLHQAGVNRLSFGVQTFNHELLKKIGRTHSPKDVLDSIELAQKIGFSNISIDLIYSLPGQTLQDFKETLETAFSLDLQHFSGYSLIIEPKTVFYNLLRKGRLPLPGEDAEAAMYELLMKEMEDHGYHQYEISNFSKAGYESRHNLTYWNNDEYYGFGAGAHSYVEGERRSNFGPLKKYMDPLQEGKLPLFDVHRPTETEKMEEELFLGLRKNEGVSIERFITRYGKNPYDLFAKEVAELRERGLIITEKKWLKLTAKGRLLGNEVFQSFLAVNNS